MARLKLKYNPFAKSLQYINDDGILFFKEAVSTYNSLPVTGNSKNDARITNDTGHLYVWSSEESSGDRSLWSDQGDIIDIGWDSIEGKPSSTPANIDDAVSKKHDHTNKAQLDLVTDGDHDVRTDNPHGVTKTQVGLGNVPDLDTTDAVNNEHTHANKATLDSIQEAFTTDLKNKLDGIAPGAEVNVNADWNSVSGDSQILNKPSIPTALSELSGDADDVSEGDTNKYFNGKTQDDLPDGTTYKQYSNTEKSKLSGIEASAVALATVKADSDISDAISKKHTQNTDTKLDEGGSNEVSAFELVRALYNIVLLAFYRAIDSSKTIYNLINGFIDEYEDESGIDTGSSQNESYNSSDDYYTPTGGTNLPTPYTQLKCNDNAGNTTVTDDGSGTNNGTASTNTSNLSVTGKINQAFEFNGSDEYVNLDALEADINADTTGSIIFWYYYSAGTGSIFMFGDTDDNAQLALRTDSTNWAFIVRDNSAVDIYYTFPKVTDAWTHLALVQNGTQLKIYQNGSEITPTKSTDTDPGAWFDDTSTIDNGRLACHNYGSGGNGGFFAGKIDDFRYYKTALSLSEVQALYNSGSGTETSTPFIDYDNMTLISEAQSAESEPSQARIIIFEEDVDTITLNTDLKAYISKDDGSTWAEATLSDEGDYSASGRVLTALVDLSVSGIGSGTDMVYKLETLTQKGLKIHGTSLLWA